MNKVCIICGRQYETDREDQIYCSRKCRKRAEYLKRKSGGVRQSPTIPQPVPQNLKEDAHDYTLNDSHPVPEDNPNYHSPSSQPIPEADEIEYVSEGNDSTLMASDYCDLSEHPSPEEDFSDRLKAIGNLPSNDQCKQLPMPPLTTEKLQADIKKELDLLSSMVCDSINDIAEIRESLMVSDEDEFLEYFEDLKQNRAGKVFVNVEDIMNANLTDIKKYILAQIVTYPFVTRLLTGTNLDRLDLLFQQAYKFDDILQRVERLESSKQAIMRCLGNIQEKLHHNKNDVNFNNTAENENFRENN